MDIVITVLVGDSSPDQAQEWADEISKFLHDTHGIDAIAVGSAISAVDPNGQVPER